MNIATVDLINIFPSTHRTSDPDEKRKPVAIQMIEPAIIPFFQFFILPDLLFSSQSCAGSCTTPGLLSDHLTDQPSHKQRHQNADSDRCQTDADSNHRRCRPRCNLCKCLNQRPDAHACTNDSADQQCNSCDKQGKENGNCRHKQPKHNRKHHRRCEDDQQNPQPDRRLPSAGSAGIILCIAIRALPVRIRTVAARRLLYPLQLFLLRPRST